MIRHKYVYGIFTSPQTLKEDFESIPNPAPHLGSYYITLSMLRSYTSSFFVCTFSFPYVIHSAENLHLSAAFVREIMCLFPFAFFSNSTQIRNTQATAKSDTTLTTYYIAKRGQQQLDLPL
jgi:hypothetical protein